MRALLLAAGYGTRLKPLTDTIPKCLVPINGKPLLQIWLERLTEVGIGPFLINTHYLADQVKKFVEQSVYRDCVSLIHEPQLLGTAGTLIRNLSFFQGQAGLLIHADNYCLANFQSFMKAHNERPRDCLMTMMTFQTQDPSSCGIVEIDDRGAVIAFHEKVKSPPGNLANGAVYILSSEAFRLFGTNFVQAKDFSIEILSKFIGKIFVQETKDYFIDIGTPDNYALANRVAYEHT